MESDPSMDFTDIDKPFLSWMTESDEKQLLAEFGIRDNDEGWNSLSNQHLQPTNCKRESKLETSNHRDPEKVASDVIAIDDDDDDETASQCLSPDVISALLQFDDGDQDYFLAEATTQSKVVHKDDNVMRKHAPSQHTPVKQSSSTSLSSVESDAFRTASETNSLSGTLDMAPCFESNKETTPMIVDLDVTDSTTTIYTRRDDTLYFAMPSDPNTTRWRLLVKEYSANRIDFPNWVERIGTEIVRRLQKDDGIHQFMVRVQGDRGKPKSTAQWRMATYQEFVEKTRQRFNDDRKMSKSKSKSASQLKRPVGRPRKSESSDRKRAPMREPCYNITERTVCIGWHVHPGTIKWRDVLRTFSRNTDAYPEWKDDISYLVKKRLALEFYTPFIVARDSQGNPCEPGSNGLWVVATDEEILEVNKLEFYVQRRECDEISTIDVEHKWLSSLNQDGGGVGGQV